MQPDVTSGLEFNPNSPKTLALVLDLGDAHASDVGGGGDVRPAVRLHVETLDVDDADDLDSRRQQIGRGADDVRNRERVVAEMIKNSEVGGSGSFEYRLRLRNGAVKTVHVGIRTEEQRVFGVVTDITERVLQVRCLASARSAPRSWKNPIIPLSRMMARIAAASAQSPRNPEISAAPPISLKRKVNMMQQRKLIV